MAFPGDLRALLVNDRRLASAQGRIPPGTRQIQAFRPEGWVMSELALSSGASTGRGLRIAETVRRVLRDFSAGYRPEQHYMRGPGPKWREKHVATNPAPADLEGRSESR
jgi:hypothetical protein